MTPGVEQFTKWRGVKILPLERLNFLKVSTYTHWLQNPHLYVPWSRAAQMSRGILGKWLCVRLSLNEGHLFYLNDGLLWIKGDILMSLLSKCQIFLMIWTSVSFWELNWVIKWVGWPLEFPLDLGSKSSQRQLDLALLYARFKHAYAIASRFQPLT